MKENTVERYKKALLKMRKELVGDYERVVGASVEEFGSDMPDINDEASRTVSRRILLEIGDKNFDAINQIEGALERIENDQYGICVECGEEIPEKRLELLPYAERCVECKERLEK